MDRRPASDPGASETSKVRSEGGYASSGKPPKQTHPIPENAIPENEGLTARKDRGPVSRTGPDGEELNEDREAAAQRGRTS